MASLNDRITAGTVDEITTPAAGQRVAVSEDGDPGDKYMDVGKQLADKAPLSAINNDTDFYQEGSWTPTDVSGAGLSLTVSTDNNRYVKIGNLVILIMRVIYPSTGDTNNTQIGGLPFTPRESITDNVQGGGLSQSSNSDARSVTVNFGTESIRVRGSSFEHMSNSDLSEDDIAATLTYLTDE